MIARALDVLDITDYTALLRLVAFGLLVLLMVFLAWRVGEIASSAAIRDDVVSALDRTLDQVDKFCYKSCTFIRE